MKCKFFIFLVIHFLFATNYGQLQLEEIMRGKDFIGHWPEDHQWLPNGQLTFKWNPEGINVSEYYTYKDGEVAKLSDEYLNYLPHRKLTKHVEDNFYVYIKDGRIYQWKMDEEKPKVIFEGYQPIHSVQLVKDPNLIYFCLDNDLYNINLKEPSFKQLIRFEKKKSQKKKNEQENYLEEQQLELFDVLSTRKNNRARKEIVREKEKSWQRDAIAIDDRRVDNISISPNELSVVYILSDYPKRKQTHIENYTTESGWSQSQAARPKVGKKDPAHELFVYDLQKDTSILVSIDHLTGLFNVPVFKRDYEKGFFTGESDEPKSVIYHGPYFNKQGNKAIIEIKSYDNKDRWITLLDLTKGELEELVHQHDDAWIGGPGISGWNGVPGNLGWMKDGETIWFQSEETGYSHLYTYHIKNRKKKQLTEGKFEVRDVQLSNDGNTFYLSLNKEHAGNRNFYKLDFKNKKLSLILGGDGNYDVHISPNESKLLYLYSYKNKPWELFVTENTIGTKAIQITHSTTKDFKEQKWIDPDIVQIKGEDGAMVPARIYKPNESNKNGAGVIFVHGAGYLQNAHNWWSGYYREYMFHNLLVEKGYTVLDIDYRASEGYGRDWRTAIYRHMGGWDLKDQVSGRKFLIDEMGIDQNRIGIYGGSYGGFITLMALLTEPGKFKCGAAIRSVTDWAHYNHEYTSNILNTPVLDSVAFRKSSPIYFADGLQDHLLMLHGVLDDNVQFQDVVRLSQRFIELGKENWELALYPLEPHGFKEPSSWIDEYKRILKLFEEHLR